MDDFTPRILVVKQIAATGNVLIEFFGDDGRTIYTQIGTAEVVRQMPLVAALLDVAMRMGPEVAREIVEKLNKRRTKT